MILEAWALDEQRIWRHVNTFGGYRWPDPVEQEFRECLAERPMTTTEALDEVEWLLDGGMSPDLAVGAVGRTVGSLERAAQRRGRLDLANRIHAATGSEWNRRWGSTSHQSGRKTA